MIEKPKTYITAKVPTIETGTATSGIIEARHVCRKTMTTMTTSAIASSRVWMTDSIEARTNCVVS
ncbi:hypothetical protein D3C87_2101260 [compost metagenome]